MKDIGIFNALHTRMGWLTQRQTLVAENVANASTPGFKPRDLTPVNFSDSMSGKSGGIDVTRTNALHIQAQGTGPAGARVIKSPDSEVTMDGNGVVLEEQMLKMAESRMQYEAAIGFYNKSMGLLRLASRKVGT